jgi:hypothetical protein
VLSGPDSKAGRTCTCITKGTFYSEESGCQGRPAARQQDALCVITAYINCAGPGSYLESAAGEELFLPYLMLLMMMLQFF